MFRLSVIHRTGDREATVAISGAAVFTHALEMRSALDEVLAGCDHLTIDISGVETLDLTFRALVCSLHRYSRLVNKRITLRGARQDDLPRLTVAIGCPFREASSCCHLWESLPGAFGEHGGSAGAAKGRPP